MRAFVQTDDYKIVSATNVYETADAIYFMLGDNRFKYDKGSDIVHLHLFQKFIDDKWVYTMSVRYLHLLDEEMNEELNYFESTDFNAGVIYSRVEKSVLKHIIKEEADEISISFDLPKIQMLIDDVVTDPHKVMENTLSVVKHHFEAVYGKSFTIDYMTWHRNKQYIAINYKVSRKVQPKEMTIEEIEEELGYKIKVVGNK